jgi:hypothetical protein
MIKRATVEDLPILVRAAQGMLDEYAKKPFAPSTRMDKALAECLKHVDPEDHDRVAFISYCGDLPSGVMLGYLTYYICSDSYSASDRMFYIFPEFRNGSAIRRLVAAFEQWAKEKGAFAVKLSVLGSRENESLLKLVNRLGYELQGYEVGKVL